MASTVLDTQVNSSQLLAAVDKVDPLNPGPPKSAPSKCASKTWNKQASSNAGFSFSQWVEVWLLPSDGHIKDVSVSFTLGALTAGNYCKWPAMAAISQVQLLDGTEILHQYDYRQAIGAILSLLTDSQRNTLLSAAGGAAFASGSCSAPIPLFFSRWINKLGKPMPAFPAHLLLNGLKVRILLDSAANIAAAGATVGSPTIAGSFNASCGYAEFKNSDAVEYQSYDIETVIGTVVATATATNVVCDGLTGNIAHLAITNQLATDLSTAHDYISGQAISGPLNVQVNSDTQYYQFANANQGKYDQLVMDCSMGDYSTLTIMPYWVHFAIDYDPRAFLGAINMRDVKFLRVNVTHSLGANSQVQVTAFKSAIYRIEAGRLKRYLY